MPLILHISDLHLVSPSASPALDDHKAGLVPTGSRFTHFAMLGLTFERLGELLREKGRHLDAIVATGDIADRNDEGGYPAFLELLESLGSVRPGPDRTVVVPGNHDVRAGLQPGDPRRYQHFVKFIRGAGFITPLLHGVDTGVGDSSEHLASFNGVQIIPIDSSAYSQVRLDVGIPDAIWANLESVLASRPSELSGLRRLRTADAARVDGKQLEAVRQLLSVATPKESAPLRIVAMHHHLLPVSTKEEIKSFESLSNLGLVRQFLRDQQVSIVLHGHKHTEFSYMDFVSSYSASGGNPWPVRILSGASASSVDLERDDTVRLIELNSDLNFLNVERVGTVGPGTALAVASPQLLRFRGPGSAEIVETRDCVLIEGSKVEAVYRQLLGRLDGQPETEHVVCRIEQSPRIEDLALLYPGLNSTDGTLNDPTASAANRLEEFQEVVRWWQFPVGPLTRLEQPAFTHGSRIKRYQGHLDQIEAVIESLLGDRDTSRGIVVLLSPEADQIADHKVQFPSFCLVQFKIQGERYDKSPTLDCTAYFRKQEVRYWWLVNLAELAELQQRICDALRQRGDQKLRNIASGGITTIAARARAGESAPKVQVPRIDRYFSLSRERLFAMANALFWPQMPNRNEYRKEWHRLFAELSPPNEPDRDGTPIALDGLDYLKSEIERHLGARKFGARKSIESDALTDLHRALERLLAANREFALTQQQELVTSTTNFEKWRTAVEQQIKTIIDCSQSVLGPSEGSANKSVGL